MIKRHEGLKAIEDTGFHLDRSRNIELWQYRGRTKLNNPERLSVRCITEYHPATSSWPNIRRRNICRLRAHSLYAVVLSRH